MVTLDEVLEPEQEVEVDKTGCMGKSDFTRAIKSIEKIKPTTAADGATWRIRININCIEDTIEISNSALMAGKSKFEDLFKSRFKRFLPYELTKKAEKGKRNPWKTFQLYLEENCTEVEPNESIEWTECEIILRNIAQLTWTDDSKAWVSKSKGRKLLLHKILKGETQEYYLLKSEDIVSIIKDLKLSLSMGRIGQAMNERRLKRLKNPACRISPDCVINPVWWFPENVLIDHGFNVYLQEKKSESAFISSTIKRGY
jgi:hypothetical protein